MSQHESHTTAVISSALFGGALDYKQFRKLFPATRNFDKFTAEQCANHASSHKMGFRQRQAVGQFFYTHKLCPSIAFDTAQQATERAYEIYLAQFEETKDAAA